MVRASQDTRGNIRIKLEKEDASRIAKLRQQRNLTWEQLVLDWEQRILKEMSENAKIETPPN